MKNRLKASKTVWPIPKIKQVFLPTFKIKSQINEHSFEVTKYIEIFIIFDYLQVYNIKIVYLCIVYLFCTGFLI